MTSKTKQEWDYYSRSATSQTLFFLLLRRRPLFLESFITTLLVCIKDEPVGPFSFLLLNRQERTAVTADVERFSKKVVYNSFGKPNYSLVVVLYNKVRHYFFVLFSRARPHLYHKIDRDEYL